MKMNNVFLVVLLSGWAAASVALAQAPTETQVLDNAKTQERSGNVDHSVRKGQRQYFDSLDRGQKGYLSSDDVSADPFVSQNYGKCDANHDGKLTWAEFRICTVNNPAAQRP